jgi:hypothetical protein
MKRQLVLPKENLAEEARSYSYTCNADPGQEETGWACGCSTEVNELVSEKHVE